MPLYIIQFSDSSKHYKHMHVQCPKHIVDCFRNIKVYRFSAKIRNVILPTFQSKLMKPILRALYQYHPLNRCLLVSDFILQICFSSNDNSMISINIFSVQIFVEPHSIITNCEEDLQSISNHLLNFLENISNKCSLEFSYPSVCSFITSCL